MDFTRSTQEEFMRLAMEQAEKSIRHNSNPFGAVLVESTGEIIATARNTVTPTTDIARHAELNLLHIANEKTGKQKFLNCAVFINAASCTMCAAALIQAGIRNFYYGAPFEPHTNPAASYEQLAEFCNEPLQLHSGILAEDCLAQIARGREENSKRRTKV